MVRRAFTIAIAVVALAVASNGLSAASSPAIRYCIPSALKPYTPLGEIRIRRIGLVAPLDQGSCMLYTLPWPKELENGPAHYPDTALPWEEGTAAFAGHRTTYTKPFGPLNLLQPGDEITLPTPKGKFRYRVVKVLRVRPEALWILRWHSQRPGHHLVLTSCDPPGQATRRIAVLADEL